MPALSSGTRNRAAALDYPVTARNKAEDPATADAALDAVGAPDPETSETLPPEAGAPADGSGTTPAVA